MLGSSKVEFGSLDEFFRSAHSSSHLWSWQALLGIKMYGDFAPAPQAACSAVLAYEAGAVFCRMTQQLKCELLAQLLSATKPLPDIWKDDAVLLGVAAIAQDSQG